eukprot:3601480-Amphidinium_carterae.1
MTSSADIDATTTEAMGSPPPSTPMSLLSMATKDQVNVFIDEMQNLWSEDDLTNYILLPSQGVNKCYELFAPTLYKKILVYLRVCSASAKASVFDGEEGQVLFTHTTGKGLEMMSQAERVSARYFFESPVQAVAHRSVHELFGLSPLTVTDMRILGFAVNKELVSELTTCQNGYAKSYRSLTDLPLNNFKLVFAASMDNEYIQWIGSEDSDRYCRGSVSHYECVQEMASFAKYQMLTAEMISGLSQNSGSQSGKIHATLKTHAPAAYEKATAAMESDDSSDSCSNKSLWKLCSSLQTSMGA